MNTNNLAQNDPQIFDLIQKEIQRQTEGLEMIPSENHTSGAVLEALGSRLTDKYSEGYPGIRYYGGCQFVDAVENLAKERAKKLFGCTHANVQPYSGSPANLAVHFALLNAGDTVMGLKLTHGGHMTHGLKVNFSGTLYHNVQYGVRKDGYLDIDEMWRIAREEKPKMIIVGGTAYPRIYNWNIFREMADEIGAWLLADMSHIAGLVAGGVHPSPIGIADVVTTTTHKTLRGPRGAMILCNGNESNPLKAIQKTKENLPSLIDRAIIPGLQGGPHNHQTAAIAIALQEALQPSFKEYAQQIVKNAKTLADALLSKGYELVTGGTDNHLLLIDLSNKNIPGRAAEKALGEAGITVNKNTVPFEPRTPFDPSGIRLGTPALTTRGMKEAEMQKIADFILSHLNLSVEEAQALLEADTQIKFLEGIYLHLTKEIEVTETQERIRNKARDSMNKAQKEFYLREQLKAIKQELGEDDVEELESMREKLLLLDVSDEIKAEINRQINRLEKTSPDSVEATVTRNYLETMLALPWNIETKDNLSIEHAQAVLDEDHFGLKEIKDRILDFISIRNLKEDGYAPILCFAGPPGTGKTSLGKSIAKALGRQYVRISLGGVKDEAEIRGHRRTYVGSMPGRFIQAIKKAESKNPVIIIDELDKIGSDFRGDPSAAMLEVLDPQQNKTFYDNYLGVPFDLSKIIFIATANNIDTISEPLRDRMEIINLAGYTVEEKLNIAKQHLVRKALTDTGLEGKGIIFSDEVLKELIMNYTREAGVRNLERVIRKLCSKAARTLVEEKRSLLFMPETLDKHLGPKKIIDYDQNTENEVGIANGLAWTPFGGEMLTIEAVLMPGKGKIILTGQLGDVMKESAQAALSYARAHANEFGIDQKKFTDFDIHIHIPAGAVPKDGPSGGITLLTSILSVLTNCPIDASYAMTGEINLRGKVMPIGGVKEKILAAKRNNIKTVIFPLSNKNDLVNDNDILTGIDVIWVEHADEALSKLLLPKLA